MSYYCKIPPKKFLLLFLTNFSIFHTVPMAFQKISAVTPNNHSEFFVRVARPTWPTLAREQENRNGGRSQKRPGGTVPLCTRACIIHQFRFEFDSTANWPKLKYRQVATTCAFRKKIVIFVERRSLSLNVRISLRTT